MTPSLLSCLQSSTYHLWWWWSWTQMSAQRTFHVSETRAALTKTSLCLRQGQQPPKASAPPPLELPQINKVENHLTVPSASSKKQDVDYKLCVIKSSVLWRAWNRALRMTLSETPTTPAAETCRAQTFWGLNTRIRCEPSPQQQLSPQCKKQEISPVHWLPLHISCNLLLWIVLRHSAWVCP